MIDPDADLVARLALGERAAMSDLMDRHLARIKALAWHMLGDDGLSEDVAQDTFLKAWSHAPCWKPTGKATFLTWMRRVATHDCLDRLRRSRPIYTDTLPEVADVTENALQLLERTDEAKRVRVGLDALPDRQKAALVLAYFQELPRAEAANVMEIGLKAYESLLMRAKAALRSKLDEEPHHG